MVKSSTHTIAQEFCDCTLPKSAWTHEAHLRVGLWHLMHYSPPTALNLLRERIRRYNVVCGVVNSETSGYHETITQFYLKVIVYFLEQHDVSQPIDQLAEALIEAWGDRNLPLIYYSKDRLMSKEARQHWVEPDLARMPGA
ncbi:hypothetical protein ON05_021705 [Acaryochloris sp. CCMEE 5410]|nr:hypothetical protein ON05_021705 [Acaryochloris sp. CCMEE 5410]